ncbi:RNA polymerase II C-terminal domain kinase beta subunit [Mycoemilia scoparia]|uniref:RNA polymerase II C-terminal domain kinase beta subunit n=1 Tax=Mycoemilia scoparia TaxID=417184 RepID=A0A9W7ZXP6_9FUNG|nr:RNA polymerase II C-terminal domain kinase beta subunit [Mycoemilia scoparia]
MKEVYKVTHIAKAQRNCLLVKQVAKQIGFPTRTYCTAQLVNNKVHVTQKAETFSSMPMAISCLFVASKMEETIKKVRDIIIQACMLERRETNPNKIDHNTIEKVRDSVMRMEQFVLQSIGFDFRTSQSHRTLIKICKTIGVPKSIAKSAWFIFTDCFQTLLPLQYPQCILVMASICLAQNMKKYDQEKKGEVDNGEVYEMFEQIIRSLSGNNKRKRSDTNTENALGNGEKKSGEDDEDEWEVEDMDIEEGVAMVAEPTEPKVPSNGDNPNSTKNKDGSDTTPSSEANDRTNVKDANDDTVVSKKGAKVKMIKTQSRYSKWWRSFNVNDAEIEDPVRQLVAYYEMMYLNTKSWSSSESSSSHSGNQQNGTVKGLGKSSSQLAEKIYQVLRKGTSTSRKS